MRIYDRKLKCGCIVSSDGGGGLIPCCYPGYPGTTEEDAEKCAKIWNKWKKTADYKKHCKEVQENNK